MNKQGLFSLQGYFRGAKRLPTGKPGPFFWLGNVPEASLDLSVESTTKKESFTGARGNYGKLKTGQTARLTGVMDEWSVPNLALLLHSQKVTTSSGSASAEEFPPGLVVGDQIRLAKPYASSLVITDSTGSPVTVSADDYRLVGHNKAIVELLDVAGYTQPFKAAYTYAGFTHLEFFSVPPEEMYLVFDGVDTETGEGVLIDMYRSEFDPLQNLALINSEYGSLPFGADLLLDPLNLDSNGKGGYARITAKTPT